MQNPEISNPKSKLLGRMLGFGFGILDRYVAVLLVKALLAQILDLGAGFWIFWNLDFGILDVGPLCSSSFCVDFGTRFGPYIR